MRARRAAAAVLALALVGGVAEAQSPAGARRVAAFPVGSSSGGDQFQELLKAFRDGLRDAGWVEGQTLALDVRWGEGRLEDFPKIAAELVGRAPEVMVGWGPQGIRALQQATTSIPIVMAVIHEPVSFGFVKSLARPGGNITGLAFQDSELGTKRLEILKTMVPGMRRVGLLWDQGGGGETGLRATESAARKMGLTTQVLEVRRPEDFEPAFVAGRRAGVHAVVQVASPFLATHRRRLIELAAAQRLPMTCESRLFVPEGCLMAYGPSFVDMSRRAALYVDRILKGGKPGDLPVEQPTTFELAVNTRTAKALGLTVPRSLLLRADQVIQ